MAKKRNIGASISLDGEKQFKQAISEINNGLRVTASELTLLTAKYSDNANSVKALTEKGVVLQNQINGQTEKVNKLREALANSAIKYGEADSKTMKYQTSLNLAEAELAKMEKELKDNSKELDKAKVNMEKYGLATDEVADKTSGFGNSIGDLVNALGIKLPAGADKAIRALDGTKASTLALVGVVAGLVTGLGKATIETAKYADEVLTMSKTTGLATDTIQELNYASELIDVSAETMTGSMTKMIRSMDDAKGGSKEAEEAFRKLHLRVTDNNGQLKDSEQMFYDVIDALGKMKNETERDATAMQIFGRSARELNPLIEAGSKGLKEFGKQAHEMGYVMDGDALEAFGKLDDAMQMFNNQTKAFKNSIAIVLLPVLTGFFEVLNKIDPKIIATVAIIASIAAIAITVVKGIKSVTDTFKGLDTAALKTTAKIVVVTAALIALAAAIAVIVGKGPELERAMSSVGNSVGQMTYTVNNAGNRIGFNANGTSSWRGGLTWVGEKGPELISLPQGTRIYSNSQSMDIANRGTGGGDTYIIQVKMDEVDEVYKLVEVFKGMRQKARAGEVLA